jgi:hypothetical protein
VDVGQQIDREAAVADDAEGDDRRATPSDGDAPRDRESDERTHHAPARSATVADVGSAFSSSRNADAGPVFQASLSL